MKNGATIAYYTDGKGYWLRREERGASMDRPVKMARKGKA
jgi:hypothetical protein